MPQSPIYIETDEPDKIQKLTWTGTGYNSEIINRSQLPAGARTQASPPAALHSFVADVISAYLPDENVKPLILPEVFTSIDFAFQQLARTNYLAGSTKHSQAEIQASITPDGIRSFLNGRVYKNLKRHLTYAGLTPEQYRKSEGLPEDYPMIAPDHHRRRKAASKSSSTKRPRRPSKTDRL